ncbi:MAG: hypothetical protein RSE41_06925 [Clostridia bacterium]
MFTLGLAFISWKSGMEFSWLYLGMFILDYNLISMLDNRRKRGVEIIINENKEEEDV